MTRRRERPKKLPRVQLNTQNRSPLYHQIYLILRSKIFDGEYPSGTYLPGERDLEAMFEVSRITAVRALNELAASGLVVRERGRGTRVQFVGRGYVSRGPASATGPQAEVEVLSKTTSDAFSLSPGISPAEVTVYEFAYCEPGENVCRALKLSPDRKVQYAARVWRFERHPFNYVQTYVPEELGRSWSRADLETTPLGDLLTRSAVDVTTVQEHVTATLANGDLSERLEVAVGTPILKIERTAFDGAGRPVEYLIGFYPPDRYQYEVTLVRDAAKGRTRKAGRRRGK